MPLVYIRKVPSFSRDENITATVVEGGKVLYQGQTLSLSAAALQVLHSLGYQTPAASGSEHWIFEEELLDERRKRMESEQFRRRSDRRCLTLPSSGPPPASIDHGWPGQLVVRVAQRQDV